MRGILAALLLLSVSVNGLHEICETASKKAGTCEFLDCWPENNLGPAPQCKDSTTCCKITQSQSDYFALTAPDAVDKMHARAIKDATSLYAKFITAAGTNHHAVSNIRMLYFLNKAGPKLIAAIEESPEQERQFRGLKLVKLLGTLLGHQVYMDDDGFRWNKASITNAWTSPWGFIETKATSSAIINDIICSCLRDDDSGTMAHLFMYLQRYQPNPTVATFIAGYIGSPYTGAASNIIPGGGRVSSDVIKIIQLQTVFGGNKDADMELLALTLDKMLNVMIARFQCSNTGPFDPKYAAASRGDGKVRWDKHTLVKFIVDNQKEFVTALTESGAFTPEQILYYIKEKLPEFAETFAYDYKGDTPPPSPVASPRHKFASKRLHASRGISPQ